jgi:uncharacterized membrane-anchored protein
MPFVQWSGILPSKVHIASNRQKTLCNRPIPGHATASEKPPRNKATLCKACQRIEQEEKPYK